MAQIDGKPGNDTLVGAEDEDTIRGFEGNDTLLGLGSTDTLLGAAGNDSLYGGDGIDSIIGGDGDDTLQGIDMSVFLTTTRASDVIDGGKGIDLLIVKYGGFIDSENQPPDINIDISIGTGEVDVGGFRGESFTRVERLNFIGPDGADVVVAGKYADTIDGRGGNDILKAGAGDDLVTDTGGIVSADGGAGTDTFQLYRHFPFQNDTANAKIDGDAGTFLLGGVAAGKFVNFENLTIYTGGGNDLVKGMSDGTNVIVAGTESTNAKRFYGGTKADTLTGGNGNDLLSGGADADNINGEDGNDTLYGDDGDDRMSGWSGSNRVYGGAGNDSLTVVSGADTIFGATGDDSIGGGGIGCSIDAGVGNDLMFLYEHAQVSTETYKGGAGEDVFRIYYQNASLDFTKATLAGFENLDFVDYGQPVDLTMKLTTAQLAQFKSITLNLNNGSDDACVIELADDRDVKLPTLTQLHGLILADGGQKLDLSAVVSNNAPLVTGGDGGDTVIGMNRAIAFLKANLGGGNDTLNGGVGREYALGGAGNDRLDGAGGNDTLLGGAGADTLTCGAGGNDRLGYNSIADSGKVAGNRDRVVNFTVDADKLDLSAIDASPGGVNNAFIFRGTADFTAAGQIRLQQSGADTIVEINTAGTGIAEMTILLAGITATTLDRGEFIL